MTRLVGTADDQRRFWQNTSPGGRALLGAAVFSLFATLGFLTDVTELGRSSPLRLAVITLLAGGGALAYAVVAFRNIKWMPLVVAAHVALSIFVPRLTPLEPPLIADGESAMRLIERLRVNVIGASLCIAAGYSFFVVFFVREGHRYYRLHTELALARDIHRELVPPLDLQIDGYEFHGLSVPSGEVGGDLVDVVAHEAPGTWTAYVADVSGHGVPSGVLMGMIKSAIRMALSGRTSLESLLDRLNDVIYDLKPPQMYATFAALRRDGGDDLAFTTAGHLPILCWRRRTGAVERLVVEQVPISVLPGRTFSSARTAAAPGDVFLVLTDGITEVFDAGDEEFGLERVIDVLAQHATLPLAELEVKLLAAARAHGTPHDDQSLILIRRV
jgi:sigma-B regulation protein RsbU (phosphoserine phosphatase)